jgi:hypothetical protein
MSVVIAQELLPSDHPAIRVLSDHGDKRLRTTACAAAADITVVPLDGASSMQAYKKQKRESADDAAAQHDPAQECARVAVRLCPASSLSSGDVVDLPDSPEVACTSSVAIRPVSTVEPSRRYLQVRRLQASGSSSCLNQQQQQEQHQQQQQQEQHEVQRLPVRQLPYLLQQPKVPLTDAGMAHLADKIRAASRLLQRGSGAELIDRSNQGFVLLDGVVSSLMAHMRSSAGV